MATLSELQQMRDELIAARAQKVRSYTISAGGDTRRFEYRSDEEMAAALKDIECRIAALETGGRRRIYYPEITKGL